MNRLFQFFFKRYQPDPSKRFQPDPDYGMRVDERKLAFLVGLVAFVLPLVMILATLFGTCFYPSISHYYYAPFLGDIFVGFLFFIGSFLIVYRGSNRAEKLLATLAGLAAYGVALMPTSGKGCTRDAFHARAFADFVNLKAQLASSPFPLTDSFFELTPYAAKLHLISAAILFSFLTYFTFRVFTRVVVVDQCVNGTLTQAKRRRNRIYYVSGAVMAVSILAMALQSWFPHWNYYRLTFVFESLALVSFGVSWMVKGRWLFGFDVLDECDRCDLKAPRAGEEPKAP